MILFPFKLLDVRIGSHNNRLSILYTFICASKSIPIMHLVIDQSSPVRCLVEQESPAFDAGEC